MKRLAGFFGLMVAMLVLDQAVKSWVRGAIPPHGSIGGKPFPGFFEITLTYNQGIAFGMFQGSALFMAPVALIIAGGAIVYVIRNPNETVMGQVAMSLLASGALGNLVDRVAFGRVTDMFWFKAIDFPVFNVADSCITTATILLVFTWWRDSLKDGKAKAEQEGEQAPSSDKLS